MFPTYIQDGQLAIKSQGPSETESDRDNAGFINYMAKLLSWGGPKWKQSERVKEVDDQSDTGLLVKKHRNVCFAI